MKYLRFDGLEFCNGPIKDFYNKFYLGKRGFYEGADIQIAHTSKVIIIKRLNSNGTAWGFEDYEIAHCTQFWIKNGEIVISKYADSIGGKTEFWGTDDGQANEMIEYIKAHKLLHDYFIS